MDFYQKQNLSLSLQQMTDDMTYKFEFFSKKRMDDIYLTEIIQRDWIQILDKYREEEDTTYSGDSDFWPDWLFQYYYELPLG